MHCGNTAAAAATELRNIYMHFWSHIIKKCSMPLFVFGLHSTKLISYPYSWHYVIIYVSSFSDFFRIVNVFRLLSFFLLTHFRLGCVWDSLMQQHEMLWLHLAHVSFPWYRWIFPKNAFIYFVFRFFLFVFLLGDVYVCCALVVPKGFMCYLYVVTSSKTKNNTKTPTKHTERKIPYKIVNRLSSKAAIRMFIRFVLQCSFILHCPLLAWH